MCAEKQSGKRAAEVLFQDKYGILTLAAHAITCTPKLSPFHYSSKKLATGIKRILVAINQLLGSNNITLSAFMWIEPMDYMYELFWHERLNNVVEIKGI